MASDGGGLGARRQRVEEPPAARPAGSRILPIAIALVALAGFGGIVWYAYTWGVGQVPEQGLPVVSAPEGPIKERPESPGGLEVPYQDKLVLNQDGGAGSGPTVERLLPEPETPQPPAPAPTAPDRPAPVLGVEPPPRLAVNEEAFAEEAAPTPADAPAAETAETAETPAEAPAQTEAAPPEPAVEGAGEAAAPPSEPDATQTAATPAPPAIPAEGYALQLAALRSEAAALQAWERLKARHPEALADLQPLIERADLGERGVFYRLQTGPFASKESAEGLCARLKAAGQDCLIKQR